MQRIRNLNLRTRLLAGFVWPVILIVLLAYGIITKTRDLGAEYDAVAAYDLEIVLALDDVKFYGARVISSANELILDYAIGRDELAGEELAVDGGEPAQIEQATEAMWDFFERYQDLIRADTRTNNEATNSELATGIETAAQTLADESAQAIALQSTEADLWTILAMRTSFAAAEIDFLDAINRALNYEKRLLDIRRENVNRGIDKSMAMGTTLVLGAIILIITISNATYRSVSRPLTKLQHAATEYSRGNLEVRTGIQSNDELGQVAAAFDRMARELEVSFNELEAQTIEAVLAREQAERSDRVKSQFLASMSHELRTPLNAVLNFTQFVASGMMGAVNERQVEALNKVYDSGSHLLDLINDVLDISKIEANSLQLFVEGNVDLRQEMKIVVDSAEGILKGKPVRLRVDIPEDLPTITGDRQRIRQIMLNIISNACKFTDEGSVMLKIEQVGDEVVLAIADTGPGILPEDQEGMYDPFLQGRAGLRHGGTGLGLPICKRLVEAHGGTIRFETELDKGTTFYVTLPIHSSAVTPVHA